MKVPRSVGAGLLGVALAACNGNVSDGSVVLAVTVLASLSSASAQADDNSRSASLSADGRYVVFASDSTNLVVPPTLSGRSHVYVRDRLSRTTVLVSVNTAGIQGNASSSTPSISGDGRYVAFASAATDLVGGFVDGNGPAGNDDYVRDLFLGTTVLVSLNSAGTAGGNGSSEDPAISADGAFAAFPSAATDLAAGFVDNNGAAGFDVWRRDLLLGSTTLVSINLTATGGSNSSSANPSLSADGARVAFESLATNLHVDDPVDANLDVYLRDVANNSTLLVSRATGLAGAKGNGGSHNAMLSGDGRAVVFHSHSTNLDPRDSTLAPDIFVRDLGSTPPLTELATVHTSGAQAGQDCDFPAVSFDGRFVVYQSGSASLVDGDTNGAQDVFLRDRVARTTVRASVATFGDQGDAGPSTRPAISPDGRFVAFESNSPDLVESDVNGRTDILLRGPLY